MINTFYNPNPYMNNIPGVADSLYRPTNSGLANTFVPVRGIEEAKSYIVAAGNSVMLMDMNESKFYIKTVDATGIAQPLRIFEFKEVKETQEESNPTPEYVTKEDFEELKKAVSEFKRSDNKKGNK